MLTLSDALKEDRLDEFVAQEEARGVGPVERRELEDKVAALLRTTQSEDRTPRSASSDGSTGT